jgi:uncharacterized protein YceK
MKIKYFALLFLFVFLSACGTYKVIEKPPQEFDLFPLYQGVQYDEIRICNATAETWPGFLFWIIDIPFSIVADTAAIPYYSYKFVTN